ncbi:unnamed protein product [Linum trigynum]|uniref:Uncharacterized protein n=1 Tax=Linum trigynum TaxID=586398 RepID=A0AAV2DX29_9ROSI
MGEPNNGGEHFPDEHTMGNYWTARAANMRSPIQHPQFPAKNFEVSTSVITMLRNSVVFHGKSGECPRAHLRRFHELINGIKINGASQDAIHSGGTGQCVAGQHTSGVHHDLQCLGQQVLDPLSSPIQDS